MRSICPLQQISANDCPVQPNSFLVADGQVTIVRQVAHIVEYVTVWGMSMPNCMEIQLVWLQHLSNSLLAELPWLTDKATIRCPSVHCAVSSLSPVMQMQTLLSLNVYSFVQAAGPLKPPLLPPWVPFKANSNEFDALCQKDSSTSSKASVYTDALHHLTPENVDARICNKQMSSDIFLGNLQSRIRISMDQPVPLPRQDSEIQGFAPPKFWLQKSSPIAWVPAGDYRSATFWESVRHSWAECWAGLQMSRTVIVKA